MEQFANSARTTLNGALDAVTTTVVPLADISVGFPANPVFRIRIDNEIMKVTAVSGGIWTVTRAAEKVAGVQTASTHADGALVQAIMTGGAVKDAIANNVEYADADAGTIILDISVSNKHIITISGDRTLSAINDVDGQIFKLEITQGGGGNHLITWWSGIRWPGGIVPDLTTTAGKTDVFSFERKSAGAYFGYPVAFNF